MTSRDENLPEKHIPGPGEPSIPELELDETVAPRPEEDIADIARAKPDFEDHSQQVRLSSPERSHVRRSER